MQFNATLFQEPNDHAKRESREEKFEVLIESSNETATYQVFTSRKLLIPFSFWHLYWVELRVKYLTINWGRIVEIQGAFHLTIIYQAFAESGGKMVKKISLESFLKILKFLNFLVANHIRFQIFREQNST